MFANLTTSAMLFTFSLASALARCISTVRTLRQSLWATSLLGTPSIRIAIVSRSRAVSCPILYRARSRADNTCSACSRRSKACSTARSSASGGKGFFKEIDRPQLHRTHRHGNIAVCRQDNNGPSHPFLLQDFQKLQAINIFHPDVEQDRSRSQVLKLFQKNRLPTQKAKP